jgi:hypothetical protein
LSNSSSGNLLVTVEWPKAVAVPSIIQVLTC